MIGLVDAVFYTWWGAWTVGVLIAQLRTMRAVERCARQLSQGEKVKVNGL